MASLNFDWDDIWNWYAQASHESQTSLEQEVEKDGWIFRQTTANQISILKNAPSQYLKKIAAKLKPETCLKLKVNPYL